MIGEYRVLVCGGRTFGSKKILNKEGLVITVPNTVELDLFEYTMTTLLSKHPNMSIIQGEAKGADLLAKNWALENSLTVYSFPADWDQYRKKAGYLRNKQMLEEGFPNLVVAFPGGVGTEMMIDLSRKAKISVLEIK